jgi:carboxylesterase
MEYMTGAEPYFLKGDSTGCLVLHGLAASPAETRWLGNYLAAQGHTVHGVRTAGHGTEYRTLARMTWRDWYASVIDGYHLLRPNCEKVIVVGHSSGGALGLMLASDERFQIDALAVLAAPVQFLSRAVARTRWLKYIIPFVDLSDKSTLGDTIRAEQARRGEP